MAFFNRMRALSTCPSALMWMTVPANGWIRNMANPL